MARSLSAAETTAYRERGYHFPVHVFSPEEMSVLFDKLRATEAKVGGRLEGRMNQKPHLLFPWLNELIRHPRILDAVESVVGPNILCWSAQFFMKHPGDRTFVSWHQDATYWGLSRPDVVTAWVAFTPSVPLSGCMRVIPGTHREQLQHTDTFQDNNLLSRGQEIAVDVDEKQAVDIILQPGEMSLHHVLIAHGSEPNNAPHPRIGFAIRYLPTDVRQVAGEADSATLVRGVDTYNYFEPELPPEDDLHPAALERHKRIMDRQLRILYAGAAQPGKLSVTS
ncbi:MAG TPA: phytanoyl-CoA dioxygenase family protein [Alphaproteobacteria bacterium]|nr:phytanoyl-CoA dioxygenase family protein [Alphaproteobacteria bacterium]